MIELNLAALRRSPDLDRLHRSVREIAERSVTPVEAASLMAGVDFLVALWRPDHLPLIMDELEQLVRQTADAMMTDALAAGLARQLRLDELRLVLEQLPRRPMTDY
jgi:hypothetical protein